MSQDESASLAPRLIASLVGLITVVSLFLVSSLVALEGRRLLAVLETQAATTADHLATTLAFPVWNAVFREADAQLDWVMLDPAVYSVSLLMRDIRPPLRVRSRDELWKPVPAPPEARRGLVVVGREVVHEGRPIASLILQYTTRFVTERIEREALLFAALVLAWDLSLALLLFLILRSSIFLPLRKIERWAAGVSFGYLDALPSTPGMRGEIGSLYASIARTVGLLDSGYAEIVAKEREFRSLFESGPVPIVELDLSALRPLVLSLAGPGEGGTEGLRAGLLTESGRLGELLALVRIRSANPRAIELFGGSLDPRATVGIPVQGPEVMALFVEELCALLTRGPGATGESPLELRRGDKRSFILGFATLAGHEEDWARVMLTMTDITERVLAEVQLRRALAEKEVLVKELFHRTRNSLQVIAGLVTLRESRLEDEGSRAELRSLAKCVHAMAMAQDQLHKLGDLSCVDLGDYLEELLPMAVDGSRSAVRIGPEARGTTVVIDVAMPLGVALVELAANALEHGFADGRAGTVSASLDRAADGSVTIVVGDDGVGPAPGFDARRDAQLGLDLVFALVEGQLQGEVDFDFSTGFRCILSFDAACFERRI